MLGNRFQWRMLIRASPTLYVHQRSVLCSSVALHHAVILLGSRMVRQPLLGPFSWQRERKGTPKAHHWSLKPPLHRLCSDFIGQCQSRGHAWAEHFCLDVLRAGELILVNSPRSTMPQSSGTFTCLIQFGSRESLERFYFPIGGSASIVVKNTRRLGTWVNGLNLCQLQFLPLYHENSKTYLIGLFGIQ